MLNNGNKDDAWVVRETTGAMRDFVGTVTEVPPLRLAAGFSPAEPALSRTGARRWRTWLTPLAAAATVAAVAVTLVIVKDIPNEAAVSSGHNATTVGTGTGTAASSATPTVSATASPSLSTCMKTLGEFCHIETAADDPAPLTVNELYPAAFTDTKDKHSYTRAAAKVDPMCKGTLSVTSANLAQALIAGHCAQAVRGSYVSSNGIMGTIGVFTLGTTNDAHFAAKQADAYYSNLIAKYQAIGARELINPLAAETGVASKLGTEIGTTEALGKDHYLVTATYKGHYLILTWAQYVNGATGTAAKQLAGLQQFSNDLIADTVNVALTQRMVTGKPAAQGS